MEGQATDFKVWPVARAGAWLLACVAVIGLWLLILIADALLFLMSYTQPADSYTGQDTDRAGSWFFLGVLVAVSALAVAVVRLPVRYLRLRAMARSDGYGVTQWLARQHPLGLARTLVNFNVPIMIVIAVVAVVAFIATFGQTPPAGALLWAAAAGMITAYPVTALEVFLLRRLRR